MQREYQSILKHETWDLVSLPLGKRTISARWIFKLKPLSINQSPRYKARLVARSFEQRHCVDYSKTFANVVKWETIRIVSGIAAHDGWTLCHLDVETAFFNGVLKEEVYFAQPQGFIIKGHEHLLCCLRRSLYGLKQSPCTWYSRIDAALH